MSVTILDYLIEIYSHINSILKSFHFYNSESLSRVVSHGYFKMAFEITALLRYSLHTIRFTQYIIQRLTIFTRMYINHQSLILEYFINSIPNSCHCPFFFSPQILATTNQCSLLMNVLVLYVSFEQNHTTYSLLYLAFILYCVLMHFAAHTVLHFFLCSNTIPGQRCINKFITILLVFCFQYHE